MANTLSGKLAEYDDEIVQISANATQAAANAESVAGNTTSAKTLYRYVGIVDKVAQIYSSGNVTLPDGSGITGLQSGERVLLTGQTDPTENRVYELEGSTLKLVDHPLEDGNFVEDLSHTDENQSLLYQYQLSDNSWTLVTLSSGVKVE